MDKELKKGQIEKLIEKYQRISEAGKIREYNEAQTRNEFIDPLFEFLGWDIRNLENDGEVITEKSVFKDRVDMAFYLNNIPVMFLEAKPLKADLDIEAYSRQAINYAWNKGVAYAVLTDFESIKIYNAQSNSKHLLDKLIFEISYTDYLADFERLWLLSKESFQKGALDEYSQKHGKMKKRLTVDKKLFDDLRKAREILIDAFGSGFNKISQEELQEGVQRILDRLVFIRVLEDRKLEGSILKEILRHWEQNRSQQQFFPLLIEKFRELDITYDSSLFKKHACEKWEEYSIDAFSKVINLLYGTEMFQYNFKEIPADILGGVYESYLGYIARSAKPSRAEKKELKIGAQKKRKEQGIFYTPHYIVDFIVRETLGKKLYECKTITDLKKVRVLDPACGSGSFLVRVLDMINDKYKKFNNPGGQYTKSEILLSNIYGVDLDSQAIELARLNLLIETLEKKGKLPDITSHICEGNSLISGTNEELEKYFGENYRDKKPFNWQERFSEVFKQDGFDCIIGNPPYIKEFVNKSAFDGLHESPYYQGKMDLWTMFACISIDLLKIGGFMSFIAPNNWISNAGASIFRDKILNEGELKIFIDFGDYKVFKEAGIQTMIYVFEKRKPRNKYSVEYLRITDKNITEGKLTSAMFSDKKKIEIEPQKLIGKNIIFANEKLKSIFDKLESKRNFELTDKEVGQGIVAPQETVIDKHLSVLQNAKPGNGVFVLTTDEIKNLDLDKREGNIIKPFYTTDEISRYFANKNNKLWIIYSNKDVYKNIDKYPKIKQHLQKYAPVITSDFGPFGLHRARDEKFFVGPSIFSIRKTERQQFSYVEFNCYVSQTYFIISTNRVNQRFLTGLLNSNLIYFWLKNKGKLQGDFLQVDKGPLMEIPICIGDKEQQKQVIALVDKIMDLNKEIGKSTENSNDWQRIKDEITKTDQKIDQEVYKLYDLTDEEIKIMEGCNI